MTNVGGNTISVISDATNAVFLNVNVGAGPINLAYDPSKGEIFVANSLAGSISAISDASISPPPGTATSGRNSSTTSSTVITSTSLSIFTAGTPSGSVGSSGIPEFLGQIGSAILVTAAIVGAYVLAKRAKPRGS